MTQTVAEFFAQHPVQDVECLFADLTGVGRGKSLPAKAFAAGQDLRVARAICAKRTIAASTSACATAIKSANSSTKITMYGICKPEMELYSIMFRLPASDKSL